MQLLLSSGDRKLYELTFEDMIPRKVYLLTYSGIEFSFNKLKNVEAKAFSQRIDAIVWFLEECGYNIS